MLHVYKNYGYFAWISFRRCHLSKCFKNFVEELVKFFFLVFLSRLSKKVLHHAKAYEVKRCVNYFQSETKTFLIKKKKFLIYTSNAEFWMETFFLSGNWVHKLFENIWVPKRFHQNICEKCNILCFFRKELILGIGISIFFAGFFLFFAVKYSHKFVEFSHLAVWSTWSILTF